MTGNLQYSYVENSRLINNTSNKDLMQLDNVTIKFIIYLSMFILIIGVVYIAWLIWNISDCCFSYFKRSQNNNTYILPEQLINLLLIRSIIGL